MSIGSVSDMLGRIRSVLPAGWFPVTGQDDAASASPVLDAALTGPAWALSWYWGFLAYVARQSRIGTASGINLDMVAADFFGAGLVRGAGEADGAFRTRIVASLFPKRGTRQAVIDAATAAAGGRATLFEPGYALDAGGWDVGTSGYDVPGSAAWGSRLLPFQAFLVAPAGSQQAVYAAIEQARPAGTIIWTEA